MAGIMAMPQQLIIGMPAQVIMQDMPFDIMDVSIVHMPFIMSMVVPSPGIMVHIMPCAVISQVMRQLIGIIMAMGIAGMPPFMVMGIGLIGMEVIAALMQVSLAVSKRLSHGYITGMEGIITICSMAFNPMI